MLLASDLTMSSCPLHTCLTPGTALPFHNPDSPAGSAPCGHRGWTPYPNKCLTPNTPASAVTPCSRCSHHALRFLHICLPSTHLLAYLSCLITPGHSPVLTLIKHDSSLKSLRRQLQSHSENTGMKDQVLKLTSRTLDASPEHKEANICRRLCKRRAVQERCLGCYHPLEEMPVTPGRGQVSCHCGYYFCSYYHHAHLHPCKRHWVHTK